MRKISLVIIFTLVITANIFAQQKELSKEKIIAIATEAVKAEGYNLEGVDVIYDQDNKLWEDQINKIIVLDRVSKFGILKKGFLYNYRIVYFDFKAPLRNIWVFVDKDTGEVFEVYKI